MRAKAPVQTRLNKLKRQLNKLKDRNWQNLPVAAKISRFRIWPVGEVSSVLDVAWEWAFTHKLSCWDSMLAKSQSHGRGQLRRQWHSPEGNIYAALRLPHVYPFDGLAASPAVAYLLANAFHQNGIFVKIKWPNDLVYSAGDEPQKIAGILLEERGDILIAGIGINVNRAPSDLALRADSAMPAATLSDIFPGHPAIQNLMLFWGRLVNCVYSEYASPLFRTQWSYAVNRFLLWRGQAVEFTDGCDAKRGVLIGISPDGGLCLSRNGNSEVCHAGSLRALTG